MRHSFFSLFLGTLAFGAPLLTATSAFAGATCKTAEGTVTITDTSTCHFELSGGCKENCTPVNFTRTCSVMCDETETTTCSDTCTKTCETDCTKSPSTFSCKENCTASCEAGCKSKCTESGCEADAEANCDAQCTESCTETPGKTSCTTECGNSCMASCTVQENITCYHSCSDKLTGGCDTKCESVTGGLFCDGQFIDISDVTDCDFTLSVKASATVTGSTKSSCSMAPSDGAPGGIPAAFAVVAGLGLILARRRPSA